MESGKNIDDDPIRILVEDCIDSIPFAYLIGIVGHPINNTTFLLLLSGSADGSSSGSCGMACNSVHGAFVATVLAGGGSGSFLQFSIGG